MNLDVFTRMELIGWRRYFPRLFLLKVHPRTLVQPGTQKPPLLRLLYFPWTNIKLLVNYKTLQKFQGNSFITNSDTVEWNVILWPISFVCSERVQWSSLHVSLTFFIFLPSWLRYEPHLLKERIFIKAVVWFCLGNLQIVLKKFFFFNP